METPPPDVLFYDLREHIDRIDEEERERKERASMDEDDEDAEEAEPTMWDRLKDTVVGVGDEST